MESETVRIQAKCRAALRSLDLSDLFTVEHLLCATGEKAGRQIVVRAADLSGSAPLGLVLETPEAYTILHSRNTTKLHQRHIILHELAHVLLHLSEDVGAVPVRDNGIAAVVRKLIPDLHPDLESRIRARTTYADVQEREAEQFATMVQTRLRVELPHQRTDEEFPAGLQDLFDAPARSKVAP
ncbi:hypothetical protein ACIQUM_33185 [Amycolatopsis azurea]|uniref:hypothetical protein n=1 Tax=Amycolatopsis azurea TaxID=36819 RepID=UPI0037F3709D